MFSTVKSWFVAHQSGILYESKSILKSFLTGMLIYVIANQDIILKSSWNQAFLFGILVAASRSGVKVVWAFIEPQIVKATQYLTPKS